jgi:hypothetical protein
MGLYLAVFDGDRELDGVEVGSYSDFGVFRNAVVTNLEGGAAGSRFPTLILHSDCDGLWTPSEATTLQRELEIIRAGFRECPPIALSAVWQREVTMILGIQIRNLCDCFFDVDGEPLLDRLIDLAKLSHTRKAPILFQ